MSNDLKKIRRNNLRFIIDKYFEGKDSQFAEVLGKQPSQLSRVFSKDSKTQRNIGSHFAREIEEKAGLPKNWLDVPHDVRNKNQFGTQPKIKKAPILILENIQKYDVIGATHHQTDDSELAYILVDCSDDVFAIQIQNDSMGDCFSKNTKVIFDPNLTPYHRCFILVQQEKNAPPIFRQLLIDGPYKYLKALNPEYPTMQLNNDSKVYGVFIGIDFSKT